jgi:hypothetical protein
MLFQQSGPVPNGVVQLLSRPQNAPPSSQSAQFSFALPPRRLEAFEDELSLGGREGIDLRVGADLGRILMDETDSIVSAAMAHGGRMDPGVPGSGRGVYSSAGPEGRHSFYDPRAHPHSRPSSTALTNEVPVAVELLQRHLRDLLVQRLTVTEELPQSLSPPNTSPLPPPNPIIEDSEGMTDSTPGPLSLSDRDVSLTVPGGDSQVEMDTDMEAASVAAAADAGAGAEGTVEAVIEAAVADQAVEEEPFEQYLINLMDQLSPPNAPPQDTRRLFSIPVPEPVTATLPMAVAASSPPTIAPTAEVTDLAVAEPLVQTAQPDPPAAATATSSLDLLTLDLTLIIDTIRETSNTSTDTGPITADLGSSSLPIPRHDRIPESNNESEVLESDVGEGLSSVEGHGIPLSYPSSSTVQREVALPASDDVTTVTYQTVGSSTNDPQTPGVIPANLDPQLEGGAAIEVEVEGGSEAAVALVEGGEGGGGGGARAIACPAGYEPDVFYSLPEFMQQEVADQHQEVGGSDQTRALVEVRMRLNNLLYDKCMYICICI